MFLTDPSEIGLYLGIFKYVSNAWWTFIFLTKNLSNGTSERLIDIVKQI